MALVVYDSYEKKKRAFKPLRDRKVGVYACGLTVYSPMHIGHASTYVRWDFLRRYLEHWKNLRVNYVQNITDFGHLTDEERDTGEDKIRKGMEREKLTADQIVEKYTSNYFECRNALKCEAPTHSPRATKYVPQMIKYIQALVKRGYAYAAGGNVYFDVSKLGNKYGRLMGKRTDQMLAGAGGRVDEDPSKKNQFDFVLWKAHRPEHAYKWASPWGEGMPGWHTECVVMSDELLGSEFDIKAGGMDNKFPHHECEIAQALAMHGKPHARYFFHAGLITIGGEKMAKSKGNFITASDMLARERPETLRMWAASSHYRSTTDYDEAALEQARKNVETLNRLAETLLSIKGTKNNMQVKRMVADAEKRFEGAMNDDFNTPLALSVLYELAHRVNELASNGKLSKPDSQKVLKFLKHADKVFAVIDFKPKKEKTPTKVSQLVEARELARKEKDWKRADQLRAEISKQGWIVQDTPEGAKLEKTTR